MEVLKKFFRIILVMSVFVCIVSMIVLMSFNNSSAVESSFNYLQTDSLLIQRIGNVTGRSWFMSGSIQDGSANDYADLSYTLKGTEGNLDIRVTMNKDSLRRWQIVQYEIIE